MGAVFTQTHDTRKTSTANVIKAIKNEPRIQPVETGKREVE